MPQGEYVILAQILVNRPSALGAGLDDEHIACLERHGRLAFDLDGAASREKVAVFPRVVIDLPYAGRRLPDAGEDFSVVGRVQIPSLRVWIAADRGSGPGRVRFQGRRQVAQRQQSIGQG
jgi:hypothetical protein